MEPLLKYQPMLVASTLEKVIKTGHRIIVPYILDENSILTMFSAMNFDAQVKNITACFESLSVLDELSLKNG